MAMAGSTFFRASRWWVAAALVGTAGAAGAQAQSAEPIDAMAWRVQACSACHGDQGRASPEGYFPRLAGKPAGYLFQQMQNFRDGRRSHAPMAYLLAHLTDDYLHEIAGYFSQRRGPYPPPLRPQAAAQVLARGQALVQHGDAARGLPACVACHGAAMTGALPVVPGLLGLSRDYLNSQLGAWQSGQRQAQSPDCMADVARKLSVSEVAAISAWLAAQPVPQGGEPLQRLPQPAPLACAGLDTGAAAETSAKAIVRKEGG